LELSTIELPWRSSSQGALAVTNKTDTNKLETHGPLVRLGQKPKPIPATTAVMSRQCLCRVSNQYSSDSDSDFQPCKAVAKESTHPKKNSNSHSDSDRISQDLKNHVHDLSLEIRRLKQQLMNQAQEFESFKKETKMEMARIRRTQFSFENCDPQTMDHGFRAATKLKM
jgi:hypothetical protein